MTDDPTRLDATSEAAPASDRSTDEVDEILGAVIDGRYEVLSRLGAGGMGYVFEARHVELDQRFVLKTLRPELTKDPASAERFLREAQAASRIRHPHVIDVKDFGVHPEHGAYYVMERLDGQDLEAAMDGLGPMPHARALHITRQVASALSAAHAAGIVHRDLKPANVFLIVRGGDPDFVKVLDFGLARVMDANRRLTETGQVIGTPRYMAPEQCGGEKVDARADVFSAALVLWEMLTGTQPFSGLGTYEILGKKMFDTMAAPSELHPPVRLPEKLERFLMTCLSKDPAWRPSDGAAFVDQIARLQGDLDLRAPVPSHASSFATPAPAAAPAHTPGPGSGPAPGPAAAPPRAPALRGRAGLVIVAALLALVGASAGVGLLWWLTREPTPPPEATPAPAPTPEPAPSPAPPPAPAPMIVTVRSDPPGARVALGPRELGRTPIDIRVPDDVEDGQSVRISLDGYQTREITIVHGVPSAHVQLHPAE